MARRRKPTNYKSRAKNRKRRGGGGKSSQAWMWISLGIVGAGLIAWVIWSIIPPSGVYEFKRSDLDKYIASSASENVLGQGASVYVDMSDGMNFAYATPESQAILKGVINKFGDNKGVNFFELSDEKITPLELPITNLYNYMLNAANYDKQKAPIEKTLAEIVNNNKPALLMTDFEEYKGGIIERAAYAKQYFIDWLAKGYKITFFKWDFNEKGKSKSMFLAVFDDNADRLTSMVSNAVAMVNPGVDRFVLGGHEFIYPAQASYLSTKHGGNYHDADGVDKVSYIREDESEKSYKRYAEPVANPGGTQGNFTPLEVSMGEYAEFYPIKETWTNVLKNVETFRTSPGKATPFTHLLSNLYIDFGAQNGYTIDNVEARVFDVMNSMSDIARQIEKNDSIQPMDTTRNGKNPQVLMFLKAAMQDVAGLPAGCKEITVDFDEKFNGTFPADVKVNDLFRADIVISKATANIQEAIAFFGWEGNSSLADSVRETLVAESSSPVGSVVFTYYIRSEIEKQ